MKRLIAIIMSAVALIGAGVTSVSCIDDIFDDQFNGGYNNNRPGGSHGNKDEDQSVFPGDHNYTLKADAAYYGDQNYKDVDEYVLYLSWGDYADDGTFKSSGTELAFDLLCPKDKEMAITPGKYSCTSDNFTKFHFLDGVVENNVIYPSYAYYQFDKKNAKYAVITDGTIEIARENGNYSVKATFKVEAPSSTKEGTYQVTYKGKIDISDLRTDPGTPGEGTNQVEMKSFSKVVAENWGTVWVDQKGQTIPVNDWILYLYGGNSDKDNEYAMIDVLTSVDAQGLTPGIYNDVISKDNAAAFKAGAVIAGYTEGDDNIAFGTWYCKNGTAYYAASKGQLAVAAKDDLYSLVFDFIDEDETYGGSFKGSYTGKVEFVDKREATKAAGSGRGMLQKRIRRASAPSRNGSAARHISE